MATNTSAPNGFSRYRGTGSTPTFEQKIEQIDAATVNIFQNDPVFRLSDGTIAGITTGPGPGTGILAGIFVGCNYISVAQKRRVWGNYWPGSDVVANGFANGYIDADPNAQFAVQVGGSTTTGFVLADIGQNFQFAYGTGSTANGISGAYADESVARANTATLPFRVVALITEPPGANGTNTGQYNSIVAAFNNVETKTLTGAL
jgi:hypothetical protein